MVRIHYTRDNSTGYIYVDKGDLRARIMEYLIEARKEEAKGINFTAAEVLHLLLEDVDALV